MSVRSTWTAAARRTAGRALSSDARQWLVVAAWVGGCVAGAVALARDGTSPAVAPVPAAYVGRQPRPEARAAGRGHDSPCTRIAAPATRLFRGLAVPRCPASRAAARLAAVLAVATVLLAGCAGADTAAPGPRGSATTRPSDIPPASPPGRADAATTHPLDIRRFAQNPCSALTPAQVSGLLGSPVPGAATVHVVDEPRCDWEKLGVLIQVVIPARGGNGLADVERAYRFRPLDAIRGYPAVRFGDDDDRAECGTCRVAVGVSAYATAEANVTVLPGEPASDRCRMAHEVLDKALGNLLEGTR